MARQNRTKAEATEVTEVTAEVTKEATQTEAPAEVTEAPAEVDLTAFQEAVEAALAEADESTGQLPEAAVEAVNIQYRSLDGLKPKNAARLHLENKMIEAVDKLDAVAARGYSDLKTKLSASGGTKAEKTPSDPLAAFVQRAASLSLAQVVLSKGMPEVPEGRDLNAEVNKLVEESIALVDEQLAYEANEAEDKGDGPELTPLVRQAFKMSAGKVAGTGSRRGAVTGPRRDVSKHIVSAFDSMNPGEFLTIAEIAKHKSPEYGDESPSQGAISARLFPASGNSTIEGVVPVNKGEIDGKNPKGARKAE